MTPSEIQGVVLFYVGLTTVGLAVETVRALIWVSIFMVFYRRLIKRG